MRAKFYPEAPDLIDQILGEIAFKALVLKPAFFDDERSGWTANCQHCLKVQR